jgi:hypothetical protein
MLQNERLALGWDILVHHWTSPVAGKARLEALCLTSPSCFENFVTVDGPSLKKVQRVPGTLGSLAAREVGEKVPDVYEGWQALKVMRNV